MYLDLNCNNIKIKHITLSQSENQQKQQQQKKNMVSSFATRITIWKLQWENSLTFSYRKVLHFQILVQDGGYLQLLIYFCSLLQEKRLSEGKGKGMFFFSFTSPLQFTRKKNTV